jgi:hypothetical protein
MVRALPHLGRLPRIIARQRWRVSHLLVPNTGRAGRGRRVERMGQWRADVRPGNSVPVLDREIAMASSPPRGTPRPADGTNASPQATLSANWHISPPRSRNWAWSMFPG